MVARRICSPNGSPMKPTTPAKQPAARDGEAGELSELDQAIAKQLARHAAMPQPIQLRRAVPQPEVRPPRPTEEEKRQRRIAEMGDDLDTSLGRRYWSCSLENFQVTCRQQEEVIARLRALVPTLAKMTEEGRGLIFSGPAGTGKDHLASAMLRLCVTECEITCQAVNARILAGLPFDEADKLIADLADGRRRGEFFHRPPRVLLVSDPAPSTAFAADRLMRLLESRYAKLLPCWLTINASNREQANEALGPAAFGRFADGAETFVCQWPDWRQRSRATPST